MEGEGATLNGGDALVNGSPVKSLVNGQRLGINGDMLEETRENRARMWDLCARINRKVSDFLENVSQECVCDCPASTKTKMMNDMRKNVEIALEVIQKALDMYQYVFLPLSLSVSFSPSLLPFAFSCHSRNHMVNS